MMLFIQTGEKSVHNEKGLALLHQILVLSHNAFFMTEEWFANEKFSTRFRFLPAIITVSFKGESQSFIETLQ